MNATRREVVAGLSAIGAAWLSAAIGCRRPADGNGPARSTGGRQSFAYLEPQDAADLEAMAARIIPTDDTPGATEAGVIDFIDRALAEFLPDQRPVFAAGLVDLTRRVKAKHPSASRFAALTADQQDALLREIETTSFFESVRTATITGMFALPKYGGNRDYLGWTLVGQERLLEFKPPFGWYDDPEQQRRLLGRVL